MLVVKSRPGTRPARMNDGDRLAFAVIPASAGFPPESLESGRKGRNPAIPAAPICPVTASSGIWRHNTPSGAKAVTAIPGGLESGRRRNDEIRNPAGPSFRLTDTAEMTAAVTNSGANRRLG